MKVLIAENTLTWFEILKDLLQTNFPEVVIYPQHGRLMNSWEDVYTEIESMNISHSDAVIFFFDLGLIEEAMHGVRSGVQHSKAIKSRFPNIPLLAYTQWVESGRAESNFDEIFDGVVDKQKLISCDEHNQSTYVRQIIRSARAKIEGQHVLYEIVDSYGMRTVRALFSDADFEMILEDVAQNWGTTKIQSLTSGFSGAHILRITGKEKGSTRSIVIKCARSHQELKNEVAFTDKLGALGPLGEVIAPLDPSIRQIPSSNHYYYKQASIGGVPLMEAILNSESRDDAYASLQAAIEQQIRCYERVDPRSDILSQPSMFFQLSDLDKSRALNSVTFISELIQVLVERNDISVDEKPKTMRERIAALVEQWEKTIDEFGAVFSILQHGDYHPNNILIPSKGRIVLIDLARMGDWPIGYDLARLATITRIRLLGRSAYQEWVYDHVNEWVLDEFASFLNPSSGNYCEEAHLCDRAFYDFASKFDKDAFCSLILGYRLGTLWDLIKIMSYADLSPAKRVYAFLSLWKLYERMSSEDKKSDVSLSNKS